MEFKVRYQLSGHYGDKGEFCQEYIDQKIAAPEGMTVVKLAHDIEQATRIYVNQKQPNGKARLIVINPAHITHFQIDEV